MSYFIHIPNVYNYSQKEKKIITNYYKQKYRKTLILIDLVKKTHHERLIQLIKLHCLIRIENYKEALSLSKLFYPFIRKDEVDVETFIVLSELHFRIGNENISKRYSMLYHFMNCDKVKMESHLLVYSIEKNNLDQLSKVFISQNKLTELSLLYLLYLNAKTEICPEFDFFIKENPLIDLTAKKIKKILQLEKKIFVYGSKNQDSHFISWVFSLLNPSIQIVFLEDLSFLNTIYTDDFNIIFGKTCDIKRLFDDLPYKNHFEVYHESAENVLENDFAIYLFGNYLKIQNFKYDYNVGSVKSNDSLYDFSIVIPVRNDGKYLPFAIKSCLNQIFKGSYEILISDNSDKDNNDVFKCVNSFSDERIRYIKTPCVLPLNRSFEFAYLHAKGKYLISIGSDDSLLDYTLSVLFSVFKRESCDVVSWGNARFEWPSKNSKKNSNLMIRDSGFDEKAFDGNELLKKYYAGNLDFGYMPKLYLGTCFNRNLIDKIIDNTGKFEDGYSQDIYTGIQAAKYANRIIRVGFPLAISGVSINSTGLNDTICLKKLNDITSRLKKMADYYENVVFYNKKQKDIIDNLFYMKSFSLLEFSEIMKANNYLLDLNVNHFIANMLNINVSLYCDMDFIISGLLKYDSFYNGSILDDIKFVKHEKLSHTLLNMFPNLKFFYINNFKKSEEGYKVKYVYGKPIMKSSILDVCIYINNFFKNRIKKYIDEE